MQASRPNNIGARRFFLRLFLTVGHIGIIMLASNKVFRLRCALLNMDGFGGQKGRMQAEV
jgi:hypothetical protein